MAVESEERRKHGWVTLSINLHVTGKTVVASKEVLAVGTPIELFAWVDQS